MDYQEKLRLAKEALNSNSYDKRTIEYIFPKLKENEDERIRNFLISKMKEVGNVWKEYSSKDIIAWLEKQGKKKPTDKIVPKYHEGDWVAINPELRFASPICIKDIDNNTYRVESVDGNSGVPTIDYLDNHYHLWTIQDAKYGDVLADDYGIYIFEKFDECDEDSFICIGAYEYSEKVYECERMLCSMDVHPATKEQRDLLFSKMKEAGYEWDAEKKELKKVESKSAWSEDDEKIIDEAISLINMLASGYGEKVTEPITFNGVKMINNVKENLRNLHKKLNHWKPSYEQMNFLWKYAEQNNYDGAVLTSLFRDLKKLKEE